MRRVFDGIVFGAAVAAIRHFAPGRILSRPSFSPRFSRCSFCFPTTAWSRYSPATRHISIGNTSSSATMITGSRATARRFRET